MYLLKKNIKVNFENQKEIAEKLGIHESVLSFILNRKRKCKKVLAYSITKLNNNNAEIEDYFDEIDDITRIYISCKNKDLLNELSNKLGTDLNKTLENILIEKLEK